MIDVANEHLLTLSDGARRLGVSVCTFWRWRIRGCKGRKLESVAIGGKIFTSVEAIQRFARQQQSEADTPTVRSPAVRERAIQKAERELNQAGI